MSEEKALFLIDGSNFYHALQSSGIAKGHLDYYRLAQKLAQKRRIVQVLFLSARFNLTQATRRIGSVFFQNCEVLA
jgi:hypothetical protein